MALGGGTAVARGGLSTGGPSRGPRRSTGGVGSTRQSRTLRTPPPSAGAVLPCRGWGSGRQGPACLLSGSGPAPRSPSLLSDLWVGKQAQPLGSCHPRKAARLLPGCLTTLMFPASCLVCARWLLPPLCRGSLRRIHEAPDGHPLQTSRNAGLMPAAHLGRPPGCPRPPGASSLGSRGCGHPPVSLKGGLPSLLPLKAMPSGGSSTFSCRICCGVPCGDLEKVRKGGESPPCPRARSALERSSVWRWMPGHAGTPTSPHPGLGQGQPPSLPGRS